METEQMAEVYGRQPMGSMRPSAHLRPSPPRVNLSITSGAQARIAGELTAGALAEFCRAVPAEAVVTMERREDGATVLRAEWATVSIPLVPTPR